MLIKTLTLHSLTYLVGITSSLAVHQVIPSSGTAAGFPSDTSTNPGRTRTAPFGSLAPRRQNFRLCALRVETSSRFHQCRDVRRDRGSQALEGIAAFEHRNYLAR